MRKGLGVLLGYVGTGCNIVVWVSGWWVGGCLLDVCDGPAVPRLARAWREGSLGLGLIDKAVHSTMINVSFIQGPVLSTDKVRYSSRFTFLHPPLQYEGE